MTSVSVNIGGLDTFPPPLAPAPALAITAQSHVCIYIYIKLFGSLFMAIGGQMANIYENEKQVCPGIKKIECG